MMSSEPSAKVIQQTQNQIALQKNMQTKAIAQQSIINQELTQRIRQGTPDHSAGNRLIQIQMSSIQQLGEVDD